MLLHRKFTKDQSMLMLGDGRTTITSPQKFRPIFQIPIWFPIITMNINNNNNNNNNPAKIQIIFPNPNMGPHDGAQRTQKSGRRYSSECSP